MESKLTDRVLKKLGCAAPKTTVAGLTDVYAAWCRGVPFDNVRKLIHVRRGDAGPLPGDTAEDFFEAWLAHGSGGTCWAGNGALQALLESLGVAAERAVATMLVAPDIPPNHGSVVVTVDGERWVVDASILHAEPLPMRASQPSEISHRAWGVSAYWVDGQYRIRWRNFMTVGEPMECGFNQIGVSREEFSRRHEMTRSWSPFNFGLTLNLIRGQSRIGAAMGKLVNLDTSGIVSARGADSADRRRFLVEEVGMSRELVAMLPDDFPFEPPPREFLGTR